MNVTGRYRVPMASRSGLVDRLTRLKPKVRTALIVYYEVAPDVCIVPPDQRDEQFTFRDLTDPNDPLVDEIVPRWQRSYIRSGLADSSLEAIIAMDGDRPAGRIWELFATNKGRFNGVPQVELGPHEALFFDLFVERDYRRGGLAMNMGERMLQKHRDRGTDIGYGFIMYDNVPSIIWHYSAGFKLAQLVNLVEIGERVKWALPFGAAPRFGPLSRHNRSNQPDGQLGALDLLATDRRGRLPAPESGSADSDAAAS